MDSFYIEDASTAQVLSYLIRWKKNTQKEINEERIFNAVNSYTHDEESILKYSKIIDH